MIYGSHIKELKAFAVKNNIPIILDDGLAFLCNLIKEKQIVNILEIGTAIAYSSINFAVIDSNILVDTVEKNIDLYKLAKKNVDLCSLNNQINLIHADGLVFSTEKQYDLIFIDAAKSQYQRFFERYSKNLKVDGCIVCDNLNFHGMVDDIDNIQNRNTKQLVKKIVRFKDFLKNQSDFETAFYDIGDGISVSRRISK